MAGQQQDAPKPVVLVVEDEPLLRFHAVDLIESAGYEVIEARHADDAIAILQARSDIRVVFTDIQMPGSMDGVKLAAAVRNRWPPIEIIMTSGFITPAADDIPERGIFMSKPYDDAALVRALHAFTH